MTITLADLVSRLTADVPAVSGVPSAAQYSQAVKDAIADLSRRASVTRVSTLAIVAGTASYAVPTDFQKLIRLAAIGVPFGSSSLDYGVYSGGPWDGYGRGGTLVTPQGLVPFSGSYREQVTVTGNQLTIYPTPTVSADRSLVYAAGDALNVNGDAYDTLTEDRATIALLLAKATCMERLATAAGSTAKKISGLGYTIDGAAAVTAQRTQAQELRTSYLASIASLNAGNGGLA